MGETIGHYDPMTALEYIIPAFGESFIAPPCDI